ncbi:hypothetical protein RND71_002505 [Anisodus tanguticus]|uniref:Uncharacterized protein n=1 Tax=Anisodus tanguticus TaxID=243964 RepID=A0AAE1T323_9SOLA|nr:hypothetical protein RND71_002505 [Anisodus tanguticus]
MNERRVALGSGGVKTGFRLFLFEKEEVTGQAKNMLKEQMLLFETKALAETYLPLKNTIDNGVREALKKAIEQERKDQNITGCMQKKREDSQNCIETATVRKQQEYVFPNKAAFSRSCTTMLWQT